MAPEFKLWQRASLAVCSQPLVFRQIGYYSRSWHTFFWYNLLKIHYLSLHLTFQATKVPRQNTQIASCPTSFQCEFN